MPQSVAAAALDIPDASAKARQDRTVCVFRARWVRCGAPPREDVFQWRFVATRCSRLKAGPVSAGSPEQFSAALRPHEEKCHVGSV